MLAGFRGHLLSEQFLEQHVTEGETTLRLPDRRLFQVWRQGCAALGPAASLRAMLEIGGAPLARVLGFGGVIGEVIAADAVSASLTGGTQAIALVVAPWGSPLDPFWRLAIVEARRRSASWCLLFNGTHVRLVEASRVYSRRYLEFDIDLALDDDMATAVFWQVFRASSFFGDRSSASPLYTLMRLSDSHAAGVSRFLKEGVRSASASILGALLARKDPPAVDVAFEQGLTIVYRVLFLLFAEARGLAPLWHPVYRESYSVASMREAAEHDTTAAGLWDALRAVSRMAHAGCRAGSLRVTAFNGRLFAPSRTPLVERRDLDDEAARDAILALSTRPAPDRSARQRIAYRDLGVEQLGAVYETLLDYEPRVDPPAQPGRRERRRQVSLSPGSDRRKATGTFYTPQSIADYLTRRTLMPLVANADPSQILALRILDPAMGSGAFLVSASAFLAQAYEAALVRSGTYHSTDLGPEERASIRRTIAERCLYGVDANPMAVQLARLSIWLKTLSADRPLSFLDHHLQAGDSLLGAWVSSLRHAPTGLKREPRDAPALPLFDEGATSTAMREALPARFSLEAVPDDTAEQVRLKERTLAALNQRQTLLSKWKRVADLWCGRWFSPLLAGSAPVFRELSECILSDRSAVPAAVAGRYLLEAERIAAERRFFHWELEFPEVFFDASGARLADGGFDAVLGNPPWDMIRADAGNAGARAQARAGVTGSLRFTRDSGVYRAQSEGHANCYQLFVERAVALARRDGRIGLVLPGGFALDHGSARLRRMIFDECDVDSIVGFENRRQVFPIHRSVRFLLVTATRGAATRTIGCRLGECDPAVLESAGDEPATDPWFQVRLSATLLRRLSGDDLGVPDFRTPVDLAIAERAASIYPPLADPAGWNAHFSRELNATDDRDVLLPPRRGLPVIEGKAIEPFRVRADHVRSSIPTEAARKRLGSRHERSRLAYRDVASATNRQTLIAAVVPAGIVSTHTLFCLRTLLPLREQHFLCGIFNSLVVNYLVRMRVATHVTTAIVQRLPIPQKGDAPRVFQEISAMARLLSRQPCRDEEPLLARLNAHVARLYQLTPAEFAHVLSTFPLVPQAQRDAAMKEFLR